MEHLTALDASFLEAEDSDPHVSLAVGGVSIVAGPVPGYDELVSAFAERVRRVPRCTQILRTHPLDLGSPEWVNDPHFDISRHLYHVALPEPGDDAELFQMIANLMQHRLDRERPLWECWIIEGLTDNRWAMLMKLHHCIADGIATTQMLAKLSALLGPNAAQALDELKRVKDYVTELCPDAMKGLKLDFSIARGLDYYTGTV